MYFPLSARDITTLRTPDLLVPVKAAEAKEIYEIAARLQQRITAIMRYAAQSGIISYNPAVDMAGVNDGETPAPPCPRLKSHFRAP
jgi:integrase